MTTTKRTSAFSQAKTSTPIGADNPIRTEDEDALDRTPSARRFAEQTVLLDSSEGIVVGVLGPWGSGKTSFVNLAKRRWKELGIPVLDFNPWMFSGTEQLVSSFFTELSAQLKVRSGFKEVGESLEDYGEAFSGRTIPEAV